MKNPFLPFLLFLQVITAYAQTSSPASFNFGFERLDPATRLPLQWVFQSKIGESPSYLNRIAVIAC